MLGEKGVCDFIDIFCMECKNFKVIVFEEYLLYLVWIFIVLIVKFIVDVYCWFFSYLIGK